jgi:hypothetical protein
MSKFEIRALKIMRYDGTELQSADQRTVMRRFIRISLSLAATAFVAFVLLLAASLYSYFALTEETLIAEIEFDRTDEQSYLAYLRAGDFCSERVFAVLGDQWRIDAQFLKWHYWASLLGLESRYRLERLEGRYRSIDEQNSKPTLSHALAAPSAIDVAGLSEHLGRLNFLVDASYGSSTYHDIDTSRLYLVYKSPTGIFTRSRPRAGSADQAQGLSVEIRHGCGAGPGLVARAAGAINRTLDRQD